MIYSMNPARVRQVNDAFLPVAPNNMNACFSDIINRFDFTVSVYL
jgi:hypothetical protein